MTETINESKTADSLVCILLCTISAYLLVTFITARNGFTLLSYPQIVFALIGAVSGTLIAAFAIAPPSLQKIRKETFSFVGIGVALILFSVNTILPKESISTTILTLAAAATRSSPTTNVLFFSLLFNLLMVIIIIALFFKISEK